MKTFREFTLSESVLLTEKLITVGGKTYPKFGTVVIMAGGGGSGKGFIKNNLLGAEGYSFDPDFLKELSAKTPAIEKRVKDELGVSLAQLASDMKNPENVARMHEIIGDYLKLGDKRQSTLAKSILTAHPDRKPNLIFDVTLKDLSRLQRISRRAAALGYDMKNIHIVWVVNDIEIAKKQNAARDRTIPVEILVNTHRGVSQTMHDILNMGTSLSVYMDGDIIFVFNKAKIDVELVSSGKGGSYITKANYVYVKRTGKPVTPIDKIEDDIRMKIKKYVPAGVEW